jgi:putative PEP-CTERM system integral membrane protein
MKRFLHALFHLIFWIWNLVFLSLTYLLILPFVAVPLAIATFEGQVPLEFSLTVVALIAVPTVCTVLGGFLIRQPSKLIRLFYGVEAPLFVLCLTRLFLLRELTPASHQLVLSIGFCIAAFLVELLDGYAQQNRTKAWMQLLAHSLMVLVGVYAGAVLLFYALPLAVWLLQTFFSFQWLIGLWDVFRSGWLVGGFTLLFWSVMSLVLFFLSATLFIMMPSMMATLYTQSGLRVVRQFAAQYGQKKALAGALAVFVASGLMFVGFQQQPQLEAFARLSKPAKTDADRQALLAKSNTIRDGLLNAYLAQYRYLSSEVENDHIQMMYSGMGQSEPVAITMQQLYNRFLSPFLYHGSYGDQAKAEKLYEEFFDTPIQKAERITVNRALESTWNRDEAKAGLLNFGQQKVWLKSQTVTVQEQGDWANVELYEVYENQTVDQQEVFYSFSLPESAVITGVWLGDTGDRAKRFPFTVSPRGAAQEVYNAQVRERVDPALLEQVGPRHYRLRAFPIPPKPDAWERQNNERREREARQNPSTQTSTQPPRPTHMHLWLTYKVMQQPQGWAMPQLGEKRNLYWTDRSQRIRNGQSVKALDAWVEPYLPASKPSQLSNHQTTLPDGSQLVAKPLGDRDYALPKNQRFAIVLDSSRSMAEQRQGLAQTWQWLKDNGFANADLADNDADLYLTATGGATPKRLDEIQTFDPNRQVFYGTISLNTMLQQFNQLRGNTRYDGVLLLTDAGSYELADDKAKAPNLAAPLWMVHLGALPPAYDDAVLKTLEASGGGVGTDLTEVLRRQATKVALGATTVTVADGYAWQLKPSAEATALAKLAAQPSGFEPLAARQWILGLSRQKDLSQLEAMDDIHAIAKRFQIVTPYSSMIVLVNDQQRQQLREAEGRSDRFQREVESGKEQLGQPPSPMNSAVPEPSTWAGIIVILLAFGTYQWKHRSRKAHFLR